MAPKKYNTRFVPAKNIEAIVFREVSGVGFSGGPNRSARDEVKLKEIGEFVYKRAREIASEPSVTPRRGGGLRRARLQGKSIKERSNYDFRRDRIGGEELPPPYLTSFTEPLVSESGGKIQVRVLNLSPRAEEVEHGTGKEKQPLRAGRKKPYVIPITHKAFERISKRRDPKWMSSQKAYRAAASRQWRLAHHKEVIDRNHPEEFFKNGRPRKRRPLFIQEENRGTGSKTRLARLRSAAAKRAAGNIGKGGHEQITRQVKGYDKRFIEVKDRKAGDRQDQIKLGQSRTFKVKRRKWLRYNKVTGEAWMGTPNASRYEGYGIFFRAMQDAVREYF